jgi:signal transduction histidine kinase
VRLNLWYGGMLTLVVAASVLGSRALALGAVHDDQELLVAREVEQHRLRIEGAGLANLTAFVSERHKQSSLRWFVRVIDPVAGTQVYEGPVAELTFDPAALAPEREGSRTVVSHEQRGDRPWRLISTRVRERYWLQLGVDEQPQRALMARIERSLSIFLFAVLLVSLGGGFFLTRRALAPLRALGRTCSSIVNSGDATLRVPSASGRGELARISQLFNEVLDRNQRLVAGMRQALDNVAHDLRTPLSRLRSGAELALARSDDVASLRNSLADCVEETDRATNMLRTLMDISEAETGVMRLDKAPLRLAELAREAIDLYEHVADQRKVELRVETSDAPVVYADRHKLLRAVSNLVDNAIKYNRERGTVTLSTRVLGDRCLLQVSDTGIGIDPVHLDRIWERLYRPIRAEPARVSAWA